MMIEVTRLNDSKIMVNAIQIEMLEETPDTVIMFTSGRKLVVKEKGMEIRNKIAHFLAFSIREGVKASER